MTYAAPIRHRGSISAIMPVYNARAFLSRSLPPLVAMLKRGELVEVIVADDGSDDGSGTLAAASGARVLPSGGRLGPGGARNLAAKHAKGDVLWFVDADVVAREDCARRLERHFAGSAITAVFGSYDDAPPAPGFFSQYKNLVNHYYHQRGGGPSASFWAGCGAVRRQAFFAVGGFDSARYPGPSVEDIELGYRLTEAGGEILLDPTLQCTHLKSWSLGRLLATDIFLRALPWSRLILSGRATGSELNVRTGERWRALLAGIFLASLVMVLTPQFPLWIALAAGAVVLSANISLSRFFYRRKGLYFAAAAVMFHQVFYLYSAMAFSGCWAEMHLARLFRRSRNALAALRSWSP